MARTRLDPDARREHLLDAAITAFAMHGTSVATAAVARVAGVSEALVYHYFPTKDALWMAAATRAGSFGDRMLTIIRDLEHAPVRPTLARIADEFAAMDTKERQVVAMLLGAALRGEPLGAGARAGHELAARALGAALRARGVARADVDVEAAALGLLGGLVMYGLQHTNDDDATWAEPARAFAAAWLDTWCHGALDPGAPE
jgi:AcrR family transcriptional regulator